MIKMKKVTIKCLTQFKKGIYVMTDIKEEKVNTIKCPTKIDTKLKALDTLNKMSGEYTTKVEPVGEFKIKVVLDD